MELDELNLHVWRGRGHFARPAIPTGCADLDSRLPGGGWPQGAITEVFLDRYGIGEVTLLIPALASLTHSAAPEAKKWIAWIAPPFIPYAPALEQRGVNVERLLMIHPAASGKNGLWATEQSIRSGSSSGVLAWLPQVDAVALRRLQLAAEERNCWTVLFRPLDALQNRSPAALRIKLSREAAALAVEICKCRGGQPGTVTVADSATTPKENPKENKQWS